VGRAGGRRRWQGWLPCGRRNGHGELSLRQVDERVV
jgi:hypothetical protein